MQIWVDADACPQLIKEILFRAASDDRRMKARAAAGNPGTGHR